MTTDTTTGSAYPAPIEALLPRARKLFLDLGQVPSRNKLMGELKIGAPKAAALRDILVGEVETLAAPVRAGRLHLVTDAHETTTETAPDPAPVDVDPVPDGTTAVTPVDEPPVPVVEAPETLPLASDDGHPGTPVRVLVHDEMADYVRPADARARRAPRSWPVLLLALPAFVAIWSGWVGLGGLTGFGIVHPLPGIADGFAINTAITLPIGVEAYAAYALRAWLSPGVPPRARRFAKWSAIGSLTLGALGQVAYHLMAAAQVTDAPWPITTLVACLPVAVLGMGAALAHLLHDSDQH